MINMDYSLRIKFLNNLRNKIKDKNDCDTDENKIILTKGGHGNIFKKIIYLNGEKYDISLKEQEVYPYILQKKYNYKYKIWRELIILKKTTNLVKEKITQNLPILYDYEICKNKIIFYNELATGDFLKWCNTLHTEEEWESMLFQLWSGVYSLQKHLKLVHNDLRLPNLLFYKIDKDKDKEEGDYWKYIIDEDEYYIPNTGYVFVIWDYGSVDLLDIERDLKKKEIIQTKLNLNTDLHFFHDLYNRLRVLILYNKFTTTELEKFFVSDDAKKYMQKINSEAEQRFRKSGRFDEKYKIGLIYYLIENDFFNKLYKIEKEYLDKNSIIYLPPKRIDEILRKLSTSYNYAYEDIVINYNPQLKQKIPSPKFLIKEFFSKYKEKKPYKLFFET